VIIFDSYILLTSGNGMCNYLLLLWMLFQMVKFIQCAQFINKDLHMYHSETNTPALARTSNLNEELGQVTCCYIDVE
jgi:hypothetical protein